MTAIITSSTSEPGYWTQLALEQLSCQPGLLPGHSATPCETLLWSRLVALQAAANAVLSDIDDDGVAEKDDMAVLGLRHAVKGLHKSKATPAAKRSVQVRPGAARTITTKR